MDSNKTLKDEVESALMVLHAKIESLKAQVDKMCESTGKCNPPPDRVPIQKEKK
jgi:hypothetical protein